MAEDALVKTAIHGADPNWGRIVSAAGHSGVPFDEPEMSLELNGVPLYAEGAPLPFDAAGLSREHPREPRDAHPADLHAGRPPPSGSGPAT